MLNVRLAVGHLYGKQLFTWLSLVVSLMASLCAVLFSHWMSWMRHESVSEGSLTHRYLGSVGLSSIIKRVYILPDRF